MAFEPIPNYPIVNAGSLYVQGLQLSNDATTPHTILDIAAGQARDSDNINDIVLSAATTVNIAAAGAGGLDTGTVAASKLYYVYVIGSSIGAASTACMISLSLTPLLPVNYDMFRRIGAIATDGSTFIRKFVQIGTSMSRRMYYDAGVAPVSAATSGSATYVTIGVITTLVPQLVQDVIVSCSLTPNTAGNVLKLQPFGGTGAYAEMSACVTTKAQFADLMCPCALNGGSPNIMEIDYETSEASDTVAFLIQGYVDNL